MDDEILTLPEVAQFLRVPEHTLRYWRQMQQGPASFKIGRKVVYWRSVVLAWVADREGATTSLPSA